MIRMAMSSNSVHFVSLSAPMNHSSKDSDPFLYRIRGFVVRSRIVSKPYEWVLLINAHMALKSDRCPIGIRLIIKPDTLISHC